MATSSNYYDGKSLIDCQTENETNQQTQKKPTSTSKQQYSYCQNDNSQSKGRNEKPPDPPDKKEKEKLDECVKEKERILNVFQFLKAKAFDELTNTPTDYEELKNLADHARTMLCNWQNNTKRFLQVYSNLNLTEQAQETKRIDSIFINKVDELVTKILTKEELKGQIDNAPRNTNYGIKQSSPPPASTQSLFHLSSNLPRKSTLSLDSMLTGKEFNDIDENKSTIVGGTKRKIFPSYKMKNQEPSSILKQPTMNVKTTPEEVEEMELEGSYRESLIYQQMKTARYDLNNCTLLDYDTTHFDKLLKDLHESVENWQEMNTQLAKIYANERYNAEKAEKKKENSKMVNRSVKELRLDIFRTIRDFHEQEKQTDRAMLSDCGFSEISEGNFDVLHGQDRYDNAQNPIYPNDHSRQQDAEFLGKIFDDAEAQQRKEFEERAMRAKKELYNQNRRNETNYPSYFDKVPFATAENRGRSHFHGGGMAQGHTLIIKDTQITKKTRED